MKRNRLHPKRRFVHISPTRAIDQNRKSKLGRRRCSMIPASQQNSVYKHRLKSIQNLRKLRLKTVGLNRHCKSQTGNYEIPPEAIDKMRQELGRESITSNKIADPGINSHHTIKSPNKASMRLTGVAIAGGRKRKPKFSRVEFRSQILGSRSLRQSDIFANLRDPYRASKNKNLGGGAFTSNAQNLTQKNLVKRKAGGTRLRDLLEGSRSGDPTLGKNLMRRAGTEESVAVNLDKTSPGSNNGVGNPDFFSKFELKSRKKRGGDIIERNRRQASLNSMRGKVTGKENGGRSQFAFGGERVVNLKSTNPKKDKFFLTQKKKGKMEVQGVAVANSKPPKDPFYLKFTLDRVPLLKDQRKMKLKQHSAICLNPSGVIKSSEFECFDFGNNKKVSHI